MTACVRVVVMALVSALPAYAESDIPAGDIRSGSAFLSAATRTMQDDDSANPAMLAVADGEALWRVRPVAGSNARSCADCHGDARVTFRGVAARYPAVDSESGVLLTLDQRVEHCRTARQGLPGLGPESTERLAMAAFIGLQSRGIPGDGATAASLAPHVERGAALFSARIGQLDLSCKDCHTDHWGQRLGGSIVPQGHANGYPIYRLEWQGMGSLQRRIRGCLAGVRAEIWPDDAPEYGVLETYLKWRAKGLPLETPAVRP